MAASVGWKNIFNAVDNNIIMSVVSIMRDTNDKTERFGTETNGLKRDPRKMNTVLIIELYADTCPDNPVVWE